MFICMYLRVLAVAMQTDLTESSTFVADKMSDRGPWPPKTRRAL